MDVLRLARPGPGEPSQSVEQRVDLIPEVEGVGDAAQVSEGRRPCGVKGGHGEETVEGRLGAVVGAGQAVPWPSGWGRLLAHDRVKEVVEEPHAVVNAVEQVGLGDGVEAGKAEVAPHQGAVFLLDEGMSFLRKGRVRERVR